MAELLRGRPALTAEWIVSLGLDLLSTASLVVNVHEFEGLGTWLLEAHSALPSQLRDDLDLALRLTRYPGAVVEALAAEVLTAGKPGHASAEALFADIAALDETTCRRMAEAIVTKSIARHDLDVPQPPINLLADLPALQAILVQMRPPVDAAQAADMLHTPTVWRDLLVRSLQQFWQLIYREQWEQTRDQLQRSVEQHRRRNYPADIRPLFTAVTGRQVPESVRPRLTEIEHVRFVPSLYLGPYVSFLFNGPIATIYYNGQGTALADNAAAPPIEDLYHPLTALADKTRLAIVAMLNGRELYAQEIVERLGISQSAVSRHLQLMVDMKVLNVRRGERGAKFYSINRTTLEWVAQRLSEFK